MANRFGASAWTDEEIALLVAMCKAKVPYTELERILGRTNGAIRRKASELKIADRAPGPHGQEREAVLDAIKAYGPVSSKRLSKLVGKSKPNIDARIRELRKAGEIHIAKHTCNGIYVTRHFSAGCQADDKRPTPKGRRPKKEVPPKPTIEFVIVRDGKALAGAAAVTNVVIQRDPFTSALFGAAA